MKKTLSYTLALTMAGLCIAPLAEEVKGANAQQKAETAEMSETGQAISALALARQLASLGIADQDPLALIVAARIMRDHPSVALEATKKDAEPAGEADQLSSVDYLLAQAKEISGGNAAIIAMADDIGKADATRGAVGGSKSTTDRVKRGHTDIWRFDFRGGRSAEAGVVGDGGDIDCYVYDEGDHLIDSDTDYTSTCMLEWTPAWTGEFSIHIKNLSSSSVPYLLLTN